MRRLPTESDAMREEAALLDQARFRSSRMFQILCNVASLCFRWRRASLALAAAVTLVLLAQASAGESVATVLALTLLSVVVGFIAAVWLLSETVHLLEERLIADAVQRGISPPQPIDTGSTLQFEPLDRLLAFCRALLQEPQKECSVLAEEHRELLERYELLTNNLAAAVIIFHTDGTTLYASPYTQVLTGFTSDELGELGGHGVDVLGKLILTDDKSRYERAMSVSQLGEEMLVRYRIKHKSGLTLWLETQLVPVCDEEGEVRSIMSLTIDVTDSLSYQEQIEEQNRDLSDFAFMVSHDLKAPIFTIKGMAQAILEDHGSQLGDGRQMLEYILDGTQRLEELVASVLEYSSVATKEIKETEVNLNSVLDAVMADLSELIKEKRAIISHAPQVLPVVRGDEIRVYQVLSNLLGNSLKYASPERVPAIQLSVTPNNRDWCTLAVSDNGLGIPSHRQSDIFRPYHRAHGKDIEGSGIGLACVKKIVERMGGTVSVDSIEGKGSTFRITLPLVQPTARQIPEDYARIF